MAAQAQEAQSNWRQALSDVGVVGAYSELGFGRVDENSNIPFADSTRFLQWRVGAIASYFDTKLVVTPSVTLKTQSGSGANQFAPRIDTRSAIAGASLAMAYAPTTMLRFQLGGSVSRGEQTVTFNAAGTSDTDLFSSSVFAGVGVDVYRDLRTRVTISDQLAYHYGFADYAPNNSIDDSASRIVSNTLSVKGQYRITATTSVDASVGLVSLLKSETFAAEDELDTTYGIIAIGASHQFTDGPTLYGTLGTTIGNDNSSDLTGKLGLRFMF